MAIPLEVHCPICLTTLAKIATGFSGRFAIFALNPDKKILQRAGCFLCMIMSNSASVSSSPEPDIVILCTSDFVEISELVRVGYSHSNRLLVRMMSGYRSHEKWPKYSQIADKLYLQILAVKELAQVCASSLHHCVWRCIMCV